LVGSDVAVKELPAEPWKVGAQLINTPCFPRGASCCPRGAPCCPRGAPCCRWVRTVLRLETAWNCVSMMSFECHTISEHVGPLPSIANAELCHVPVVSHRTPDPLYSVCD
jgi:hypothetical protein